MRTICNVAGGSLVQITMYIIIHQTSDQSHQSFKVCRWQARWSLSVFQLSHRNAHKTHLNLSVVCSNLSVIFVLMNQFLVKSISPWAACTDQAQRKNYLPPSGWTFIGHSILRTIGMAKIWLLIVLRNPQKGSQLSHHYHHILTTKGVGTYLEKR